MSDMKRDERDPLTGSIIEAAIEVHDYFGPGLYSVVHAQVLTYLTLASLHRGLIINFNVRRLKDGVTRLVR